MKMILILFTIAISLGATNSWAEDIVKHDANWKPEAGKAQDASNSANKLLKTVPIHPSKGPAKQEGSEDKRANTNGENGGEHNLTSEELLLQKLWDPITWFTLVLAFYTVRLWKETKRLAECAEKTSQNQLRAYVSAQIVTERTTNGFPTRVRVEMRNEGQTPAKNLSEYLKIAFASTQPEVHEVLNTAEYPSQSNTLALFNGKTVNRPTEINDSRASADVRAHVLGADYLLFCSGEIKYEDIFGIKRITKYRYQWNSQDGAWLYTSEGNSFT